MTEIGTKLERGVEEKNKDKIKNVITELKSYLNNLEIIYEEK
ncbi:MAG: hypothetical protein ACOCXB_03960 [Halanaerobium sp.]